MWISTFNNSGQGYVSGNSVKHLYRWSQPPLYICCGLQDLLDTAQLDVGFSRALQHVRERQTATGGWKNPHRRIHAPWSGGGRLLRLEGEMDPGWPTSWHFVAEIQASRFWGRRWGGWSFGRFSGELKNIELLYILNLWPNISGFEMRIFWELSRRDTSWHLEWNCFLWRMPPLLYRRNIWRYCILWSLKQQSGYCTLARRPTVAASIGFSNPVRRKFIE